MTNHKKRKAARIVRDLTPEESEILQRARNESLADKVSIIQMGKSSKTAWKKMRIDVNETARQLQAERIKLGLSLSDVESRSGLRKSALSRLENDESANPTFLTLQRYAAALGMVLKTTLLHPNQPSQ